VPEEKSGDAIEEAMAEAVASVEARERSDDTKKDPGEAVTEALIEAKRELESALQQTQKEAESFRDKWLRAAADLENYRKRAAREREDVEKFANEKLLKDLLPVLDDLDRALGMAGPNVPDEAKKVVDGLRLVQKKFVAQLEKHGVTTFESVGKSFDPSLHEAVQQVHADSPAGSVAVELQRGFLISGRLLRPALVTVSLGPKSDS
jgi:molecular chaperone GrpE